MMDGGWWMSGLVDCWMDGLVAEGWVAGVMGQVSRNGIVERWKDGIVESG